VARRRHGVSARGVGRGSGPAPFDPLVCTVGPDPHGAAPLRDIGTTSPGSPTKTDRAAPDANGTEIAETLASRARFAAPSAGPRGASLAAQLRQRAKSTGPPAGPAHPREAPRAPEAPPAVRARNRMTSTAVPLVAAARTPAGAAWRRGSRSADSAGAELDADARTDGLRRLGNRVFPGSLAGAAHDDQVAQAQRVAEGFAASARPE
jgi:hypothetical protein